jgi:catechol 2,3-dioxygenase-like lactoylglutathione lyase family enzyme
MKPLEMHHVQLTVPHEAEEASRKFYGELLGLEEFAKPEPLKANGGAWFRGGDFELHVSLEDGIDNRASRRHICYMVEDLDDARRTMETAGVEIIPDNQPIDDWVRFYVRDPGGNRIELAQQKSKG